MSLPLEDIIIIIDTREQNEKRISAVEKWGELHGGIIEHKKLDHLDYHLQGIYKGHEINIGIEAKALSKFCSDDYALNKEKLFAACGLYDQVALFIETGNYEFKVDGFGETNIFCRVKQDLTITGKLAIFEGACSTLGRYGIHVRQLRSEAHFPYAIENLLTYSIYDHELMEGIKDFKTQYKQALLEFCTPIQTKKLMQHYPNFFWLCSAGEDAYQAILGKKTGTQLYNFIRNPELVTQEWSNQHFPDGTDIESREYDTQDVIKAVVDYLTGFPGGKTADEICTHFNLILGDEDKEKMLECLKKMAYKGLITNTVTGLFHIPTLQSQSTAQEREAQPPVIHSAKLKLGTRDTSMSHCDPAESEGTFLTKNSSLTPTPIGQTPILSPSPADDNHKQKVCTNFDTETGMSKYDSDCCQQEQYVGCSECKDYKVPNSNDKTDKLGSDSAHTSQEPIPLSQAPVLSESHKPSPAITFYDKEQSNEIAIQRQYENEELFGKNNPDWKPVDEAELKIRNQDNENEDFEILTADHKMSIRKQLEIFLDKPHTQQECVTKLSNFSKGAVSDHIFHMKQEGMIVEFDNKTLVMTR